MTCKHKENGICGKDGPCLSPYCESEKQFSINPDKTQSKSMKSQPEALRLADALENLEATGWGGDCFALTEYSEKQAELAAIELRRLHQSETEAWRYADELEQERKKHKLQVLQLIDVIEDLIHLGKWKPEWEDARNLIKEIQEKNNV